MTCSLQPPLKLRLFIFPLGRPVDVECHVGFLGRGGPRTSDFFPPSYRRGGQTPRCPVLFGPDGYTSTSWACAKHSSARNQETRCPSRSKLAWISTSGEFNLGAPRSRSDKSPSLILANPFDAVRSSREYDQATRQAIISYMAQHGSTVDKLDQVLQFQFWSKATCNCPHRYTNKKKTAFPLISYPSDIQPSKPPLQLRRRFRLTRRCDLVIQQPNPYVSISCNKDTIIAMGVETYVVRKSA